MMLRTVCRNLAGVIGFFSKQHVVFAKLMNAGVRVCLWRLVPESELALPRK